MAANPWESKTLAEFRQHLDELRQEQQQGTIVYIPSQMWEVMRARVKPEYRHMTVRNTPWIEFDGLQVFQQQEP